MDKTQQAYKKQIEQRQSIAMFLNYDTEAIRNFKKSLLVLISKKVQRKSEATAKLMGFSKEHT